MSCWRRARRLRTARRRRPRRPRGRGCERAHAARRHASLPEPARMTGFVHLVGAGPGDLDLLTRRAYRAIEQADTILYDRLIPPGLLEQVAHADAELIYVGKEGRGPQMPQDEIDALLVAHARAGKRVVRLKGGDP